MRFTLHPLPIAIFSSIGLVACDQTSATVEIDLPSDNDEAAINFEDGFQQSDADAIIRECNAEDMKLEVGSTGEITFEPSPSSDYEAAACVLNYIKESGTTKFGFVGNERYVTPESE